MDAADRVAEINRLARTPLITDAPPLTNAQQTLIALAFNHRLHSGRTRGPRRLSPSAGAPAAAATTPRRRRDQTTAA